MYTTLEALESFFSTRRKRQSRSDHCIPDAINQTIEWMLEQKSHDPIATHYNCSAETARILLKEARLEIEYTNLQAAKKSFREAKTAQASAR